MSDASQQERIRRLTAYLKWLGQEPESAQRPATKDHGFEESRRDGGTVPSIKEVRENTLLEYDGQVVPPNYKGPMEPSSVPWLQVLANTPRSGMTSSER